MNNKNKAESFSVYICNTCYLQFSDPMAQADSAWYENSSIYSDRDHFQSSGHMRSYLVEIYSLLISKLSKSNFDLVLEEIDTNSKKSSISILDIGCGEGLFLQFAKKKGFNVTGIDHDSRSVGYLKDTLGIDAYCTDINSYIKSTDRSYSIITLFEVLEHLEDPVTVLIQIKKILEHDGSLIITVPTYKRWPKLIDPIVDYPPHHLTLWSFKSLHCLAKKAGYSVVKTQQMAFHFNDIVTHLKWQVSGIQRKDPAYGLHNLFYTLACLCSSFFIMYSGKAKGGTILIILKPNNDRCIS